MSDSHKRVANRSCADGTVTDSRWRMRSIRGSVRFYLKLVPRNPLQRKVFEKIRPASFSSVAEIKGRADVFKMGIKQYNDECRSIVMRYADSSSVVKITFNPVP